MCALEIVPGGLYFVKRSLKSDSREYTDFNNFVFFIFHGLLLDTSELRMI